MNVDKIKSRVIEIRDISRDDERAHIFEDNLFHDFVVCIAEGNFEGDIKEGAKEVLKSLDIDFARWCA